MRQPTFAPTRHALAFAILTALSAPALAQNAAQTSPPATPATDAPAQADEDAKTLDTVKVTGSRIPPRAGFDTLEPATVLSGVSGFSRLRGERPARRSMAWASRPTDWARSR